MSESSVSIRPTSLSDRDEPMPHAQLTLEIPDSVWLGEVTRSFPQLRFRILAATTDGSRSVIRGDIIGPTVVEASEELEADEAVTIDTIERSTHRRRIQVKSETPVFLTALDRSGVPLVTPCEIIDGRMRYEATVTQRQLSDLGDNFDAYGISYTVERIQRQRPCESLLTDRQRLLLHEAIERGYYDTPRRITLVELAEELGIAKSTCSETLHRSEERVLKRFVNGDCEHQPDVSIRVE